MKITDVRIKIANEADSKVEAYFSLVLDDTFAVHDLRTIKRDDGSTFLQMPSRRIQDKCPKCYCKNYVKAKFCNWCGAKLPENRFKTDDKGRQIVSMDVFHPITKDARQWMENEVLQAFEADLVATQAEGVSDR